MITCPECGHRNLNDARNCNNCGTALKTEQTEQSESQTSIQERKKAMQKWDYQTLHRTRGWKGGVGWHSATEWKPNIPDMLPKLGEEGWELVAVVPRSSTALDGASGFTDEELWVFKRPKS